MLLEDTISQTLSVLALLLIVYLYTFVGVTDMLAIPLALLLGGVAFQFYMRGKPKHDESLTEKELKNISYYTLIALGGIGLGSFLIPGLFNPPKILTLAINDQFLYGSIFILHKHHRHQAQIRHKQYTSDRSRLPYSSELSSSHL